MSTACQDAHPPFALLGADKASTGILCIKGDVIHQQRAQSTAHKFPLVQKSQPVKKKQSNLFNLRKGRVGGENNSCFE